MAILLGVGALIALDMRPVLSQAPHRQQLADKLQADLQRVANTAAGVVGVAAVDLTTGQRFGVNEGLVFPQGSAIKIPILIELYHRADRGDVRLSDRVALGAADQVGGSGLLRYFSDGGSELSLHDLAISMIVLSDNTATNVLIDRLGMERVSRTMADLGASQTRLARKMIRPEESVKGNENVSTPREAVDLMVRLARCKLPMTPASCAEVKRILEIPKSGAFREPIPGSVPVAWKPGGIEGVQTAWGIVSVPGGPYAISVMVNYGPEDISPTVREVSSVVYRYFAQIARTTSHGARVPIESIKKSERPLD
ncbi:MAG: serine hydrolase [Vicinamibacterales bacterium]